MKRMKVLCTAAVITLIMTACAADTGSNDTSSSTSTAATGTNSIDYTESEINGSKVKGSKNAAGTDAFTTIEEAYDGHLTVICDNTTGVEYIAISPVWGRGMAFTPRLNRDGTLVIKK